MYWIEAETNDEDGDGRDTLVIGLFSTPEKAIDGARTWVKKEREEGSQDDICLCGCRAVVDTGETERLDLAEDVEAKSITRSFRAIEKEFQPMYDKDE